MNEITFKTNEKCQDFPTEKLNFISIWNGGKGKLSFFYVFIREIFWINIPLPSQWMGAHSRQMRPFKCIIRRGPGILGHAASAARTSVTAISWSSWSLACYRSACYWGLGFSHFMFFFFWSGGPSCLSALKLHQYNVYLPLDCLQQRPRQNGPE